MSESNKCLSEVSEDKIFEDDRLKCLRVRWLKMKSKIKSLRIKCLMMIIVRGILSKNNIYV